MQNKNTNTGKKKREEERGGGGETVTLCKGVLPSESCTLHDGTAVAAKRSISAGSSFTAAK